MKSIVSNVFRGTFAFLLLLTTACQVSAPRIPQLDDAAKFATVQAHIEQLVAEGTVPSMSVAVARDGKIVWEIGFGFANRDKNVPATEHTPYPLASISKPLTATGLMILVERGHIDLDTPINDYLGEVKLQARVGDVTQATVRRIANHTAGLPLHGQHFYDNETDRAPTMEETIRRYGFLVTKPGERWQYSNLGYGLLGDVLSRISGHSYANFMRDKVFVPLGMHDTSVHSSPGLKDGQAVKYTHGGTVVPPYHSDSPGSTAIYSSAHDLIRFALLHLHNALPEQKSIITETTINTMQNPGTETSPTKNWEHAGSGYGIGWFVGTTEDGLRVVYHNGGTVGVSTGLALVPDENLAVTVLCNTDGQWADMILIEILCTLLSRQPEAFLPTRPNGAEPSFTPDLELTGTWKGWVHTPEEDLPLTLEIHKTGGLYATLDGQPRVHLQNVSYQDRLPQFLNAGGGPFLRGSVQGHLETADANRGRPYKLWLELKRRGDALNGSLIVFSQRTFYTGPIAYWVTLRRQ